ncbi:hypothetical protein IWGMT90018_60920 [Mycobacterium kiyosense]|nr:hypothetical protein IWGMT90018_60920 [Mycobacterium kiyosense]
MAGPAYTFSWTACAVKPSGASTATLPASTSACEVTPQYATEVVDVAVGVDDRDDGTLPASVGPVQLQRRGGGLGGHQGVDDDDAGVALDEADVGDIQTADLVDARNHFVEALLGRQCGLAPQAGVHRRGRRAGEECVQVVVPHHPAVGRLDDAWGQGGDEAAVGVVEVSGVVHRQRMICVC